MHLNHFDSAAFLRESWQKQPVLIKNPWAEWINPLSSDELAGLACEDHIEARLITQPRPDRLKAEFGPFPENRFGKLGKAPWTLLVQAVDHHVPEVAALIEPFRFVPNWRIDDVMVSYASDGGGVGAHFDHYDVFLIQGQGQRRWQIGQLCDDATELLPHDELRLLAHFEPSAEWLLDPGDILYVPPRFAHNGVAVGDDCMTYSVGFRAPSRSELIAGWCDDLADQLSDEDRYSDPGLIAQPNPGEITAEALVKLHTLVTEKLADRIAFARWFGGYSTTRKYPDIDWGPEEPVGIDELHAILAKRKPLLRNPASRFSFIRADAGTVLLFVDGEEFTCEGESAHFAESLCAAEQLDVTDSSTATGALLLTLFNMGSIGFDREV
jgi:50S ribosomal protein L16 3-hydroxylase